MSRMGEQISEMPLPIPTMSLPAMYTSDSVNTGGNITGRWRERTAVVLAKCSKKASKNHYEATTNDGAAAAPPICNIWAVWKSDFQAESDSTFGILTQKANCKDYRFGKWRS